MAVNHADVDLGLLPEGAGQANNRGEAAVSYSRVVKMSDVAIRKNNRLGLLMGVHERWKRKRGGGAPQTETEAVESMGKATKGTCEVCGATRTSLRMNHGKNMCGGCQSAYAHVFNRLPLLATVVGEAGKVDELLGLVAGSIGKAALMRAVQPHAPEEMQIGTESDIAARIARVLGCNVSNGDEMVDLVARMVDASKGQVGRLWEVANELGLDEHATSDDIFQAVRDLVRSVVDAWPAHAVSAHPELTKALFGDDRIVGQSIADTAAMQTAAQLEDLQRKAAVICRHCGAESIDDAIKHVAHSEAILIKLMDMVGELAEYPSCIPALIERQGDEIHNMRINLQAKQDHINLVTEQLSEDEQRLLANEQVFAKIREVIGCDSVHNSELPGAIEQILYAGGNGGFACIKSSAQGLDSHLLDMALDAMRGKITGLDPDRIAILREAA